MVDLSRRSAGSPVDRLAVVREWLWRHSSQPNGDPWDGDPEHLDCAAQTLLNDLAQQLIGTDPPTSAAAQLPRRAWGSPRVHPSASALVPQLRLPGASKAAVEGARADRVCSGHRPVTARAVALNRPGELGDSSP